MAKSKKSKKSKKTDKNNGPTLAEKPTDVDVDASAGGIGVELGVSDYDTTSVDIVVGFDVSPLDVDIGYDVSTGELSGSVEIGLPGDLIGITGGLTVNSDGEITAIEGGIAIAGMEVTIEKGVGKYSCRTTSTITFFGIGYSVTEDNCTDGNDDNDNANENNPRTQPTGNGYSRLGITPGAWIYTEWTTNNTKLANQVYPEDWDKNICIAYATKGYSDCETMLPTGGGATRNASISLMKYGGKYTPPPFFIYSSRKHLRVWEYIPGNPMDEPMELILEIDLEEPTPWPPEPEDCYTYTAEEARNSLVSVDWSTEECFAWDPSLSSSPPPPPPPDPRPRFYPTPYKKKEKNPMQDDCCLAIYQLLTAIANVTGVSQVYQYPRPIQKGDEVYETQNLIDYLANQPNLGNVIGHAEDSLWPKTILVQRSPTHDPAEVEVHNLTELLELIGGSTGYARDKWPEVFTLEGDDRKITYRSNGEALIALLEALAVHKLKYGCENKGYAIPKEQLIPGATDYDFTKDYLGILTRQFSATQRYGFDSPLWIEINKENNAGFEIKNLAGAIEKLLYYHMENGEDIDRQTNILVRLSYLNTRIYQLITRIFYRVGCLLDGLSINTRNQKIDVPCEFNPSAGVEFKGFGINNNNDDLTEITEEKLDIKDDDTTDKLLLKFLENTKISQVIEIFKRDKKR